MRLFLIFIAFVFFEGCNNKQHQGTNIYLANNDSIYYCENENFNAKKLQSSKINDTTFVNQMLQEITKKKHEVLLKPMTSFSANGDGVGEAIEAFCSILKIKGVSYRMTESDSAEKKYFDAVTILEFSRNK
jgi:hypothetical protein